jgi:putative nucleotidyltransferase with HDIG domain
VRPTNSRGARAYVITVISLGVAVVCDSLLHLIRTPVPFHWFILAGLTLLSGSFTVRIPTIPARLSVSETFVFAGVLLYGPEAATAIVVLDSLIISLWLGEKSRRPDRVLFNMAAPAVAIWVAAHAFYALARIQPLSVNPQATLPLVIPLFALAVLYFVLNSALIAIAVGNERRVRPSLVWRQNFLWLSLNYFSGASVAALLLPYLQGPDSQFANVIGVILPLLLISYLTFKTALGRVEDANGHLRELNRLYLSTIETLAMAIDAKDQITHGHIRRVQTYAVKLATAMGVTDTRQIQAIEAAALLHDMGKLAVPEYILNKPGPLTPAEFDKMKLHASVGADILSAIDFPYPVVPIVRHHHENWDGSGYPSGLSGNDIPIGARILSVVDCFDALTSDRPYRPRLSEQDAIRILVARKGNMYDPLAVDTFIRLQSEPTTGVDDLNEVEGIAAFSGLAPERSDSAAIRQKEFRLEQIAASRTEMAALLELAQDLGGAEDAHAVATIALKKARRMIPAALAAVFVREMAGEDLYVLAAQGNLSEAISNVQIRLGQRLTGWVGANRQSIRNSDPVLDLDDLARADSHILRAALAVPVTAGDELVGVLCLYSQVPNHFSIDHERVLEAIAGQLSRPLQATLARLRQPSSDNDNLTGAIMYLQLHDVDELSHSEWQSLQEGILTAIRNTLRSTDSVTFLSRGELVVTLSGPANRGGGEIADRVVASVDAWRGSGKRSISVTHAYAASPADGLRQEQLLERARSRVQSTFGPTDISGRSIH